MIMTRFSMFVGYFTAKLYKKTQKNSVSRGKTFFFVAILHYSHTWDE